MIDLKMSKQLGTIYLLKSLSSFLLFLGYCYLTIDLVRSPIVGSEGTGVERLYSHRRKTMGRFSNVVRDEIILSKATSKDYDLFIEGSLLKRPIFEGHNYLFIGNKRDYPRGGSVIKCLIACVFVFEARVL